MNGTEGLRLVSYARVSDVRGRSGPSFISESDQHQRCRSYADAYGHKIVQEGSDLDVSGGVMSRPTFDRFLQMIVDGKADGIIVAKLDRFARSNVGALEAVETIEKVGGALISVSEQIDSTTAAGRFLRSILFASAQWERERIAESWLTARSSAVERGIHVSRHVPPGYLRRPKSDDPSTDRRLEPDPAQAATITTAFQMAADGRTNTEIADYLTSRKLAGSHWTSGRINRLLANRVYLGEARSGRGVVNPDAHPPLTDEATFLLAQRDRTAVLRPSTAASSMLSGIVRCAACGFAMKPQAASSTGSAIYRCTTVSTHGRCPAPATITKARIEDYVLDKFIAEYPLRLQASPDEDQRAVLDHEAAQAEASYRRELDNLELRGMIGEADHDRLIGGLYRDWQTKLAAAADVPAATPNPLPFNVSIDDLIGELRGRNDAEALRKLLATGIQAIYVRKAESRRRGQPVDNRVRIVWADEPRLDLPRRGHRYEPRAVVW